MSHTRRPVTQAKEAGYRSPLPVSQAPARSDARRHQIIRWPGLLGPVSRKVLEVGGSVLHLWVSSAHRVHRGQTHWGNQVFRAAPVVAANALSKWQVWSSKTMALVAGYHGLGKWA
eukprot:2710368-Amphidinium_carterae.1